MFSKFNKRVDAIFLDTNSPNFNVSESVNVILSPSLYWVKKVSLPVKYARDAKSLSPSLFEDVLPEGVYSYFAYKSDDHFYIFAYEDKLILDTLRAKGISTSQINDVYLAQSELSQIGKPVKIDEARSLYSKDGVLALVPSAWVENSEELRLDAIALSKNRVELKRFSHLLNDKSLYTAIAIASLFLVLSMSEYFITLGKISSISSAKDEVFASAGLKPTMLQNRSLLKEYESARELQTKFRLYSSELLDLKLEKDAKMSLLELKAKKLKAEFVGVKKGSDLDVLKELRSKGALFDSKLTDETLRLEVAL